VRRVCVETPPCRYTRYMYEVSYRVVGRVWVNCKLETLVAGGLFSHFKDRTLTLNGGRDR
jgi:hypothetical protein